MSTLKKPLSVVIIFFCLLSLSAFASETIKGVKKDYEEFKKEMSQKLDSAEVQLTELKSKANAKGNSTRAKLAQDLEKTKNELRKQQEELKFESEESWNKMKKGLSDAAESLNKKIQNALKD